MRIKDRVYEVLEIAAPGDTWSRAVNLFIFLLVLSNVAAVVLEFIAFFQTYATYLYWFEVASVALFTLEYVLRLWSCTSAPAFRAPLSGRLRFAGRPLALIDLVAVLPFYLPFFTVLDLRVLRLLRLARLLRLLKLTRHLKERPVDEASLEDLLNSYQQHLAQIRRELVVGKDADLVQVRQVLDRCGQQIRSSQHTWLRQHRRDRHMDEDSWSEIRLSLTAAIEQLESELVVDAAIEQTRGLVRKAYADSTALFDGGAEWASVAVQLNWKNVESYKRVPIQKIGRTHFSGLAGLQETALAYFAQMYVDEVRKRLDNVTTSLNYVLDLMENGVSGGGSNSADLIQEVRQGLSRVINRLRDLADPVQAAWEGLLWELEREQQDRLELVQVDVARYGTAMFYVGRLGRWSRRHLVKYYRMARQALEQLVPFIGALIRSTYDRVYGLLRPLLQWLGLVRPPPLEVMQTLDEARLESVYDRGLPEDYLPHFARIPLVEEILFVGFEDELNIIDQAVDRWEEGLVSSFIVHGQRGGGKTTLLNIAQQRLFDEEIIRATIVRKMTTASELALHLAGLLGLQGVESFDELAQQLLAGPRRAVVLEGCHNLYQRKIGGLEAIRHLFWLIARTNHHVLWGICLDKYAFNYLSKSMPLSRLFHFEVSISAWQPQELRRLILQRHNQSGYGLRYVMDKSLEKALRQRVRHWRRPDEPAVQEALGQIYFERLGEICGENILTALYYWLRSLQPVGRERFDVQPLNGLDLDIVHDFTLDQAFILLAVLEHDNLTAGELAVTLETDLIQTRLELEILANQSVLDFDVRSGHFRVNPIALGPMVEMLENRNLIY